MARPNLLMLSGDRTIGQGRQGPFHYTLAGLRHYWGRIDVICPRSTGSADQQPFDNVYVKVSSRGRHFQPWFIASAGRRLLAERRYALMVSHDFGLFYNAAGAQLLLRRIPAGARPPLVSEIHHLPGTPRAADASERAGYLLHQAFVRVARHWVQGFRVVNRTMAAQLRRWGVPEGRIHVLGSFYLDHATFRPQPASKEWDVVYCARLVPNKAPMLFLNAVARLAQRRPGLRCAIVGEGPLGEAVARRVVELGLGERVVFLGWLPSAADLAALYNRSRLLVCSSYNEGGPRVTLEAMACGVPVITTPVGVMPDVIVDGESGYFAGWTAEHLAARMEMLLTDEALAHRLGEAGRQAVQRFDYETEIRRYAEAYLRLAGALRPVSDAVGALT